jgi:hypothetical protein
LPALALGVDAQASRVRAHVAEDGHHLAYGYRVCRSGRQRIAGRDDGVPLVGEQLEPVPELLLASSDERATVHPNDRRCRASSAGPVVDVEDVVRAVAVGLVREPLDAPGRVPGEATVAAPVRRKTARIISAAGLGENQSDARTAASTAAQAARLRSSPGRRRQRRMPVEEALATLRATVLRCLPAIRREA